MPHYFDYIDLRPPRSQIQGRQTSPKSPLLKVEAPPNRPKMLNFWGASQKPNNAATRSEGPSQTLPKMAKKGSKIALF